LTGALCAKIIKEKKMEMAKEGGLPRQRSRTGALRIVQPFWTPKKDIV
jgi:hypothetical protein